jgi:hypothetical protein
MGPRLFAASLRLTPLTSLDIELHFPCFPHSHQQGLQGFGASVAGVETLL